MIKFQFVVEVIRFPKPPGLIFTWPNMVRPKTQREREIVGPFDTWEEARDWAIEHVNDFEYQTVFTLTPVSAEGTVTPAVPYPQNKDASASLRSASHEK